MCQKKSPDPTTDACAACCSIFAWEKHVAWMRRFFLYVWIAFLINQTATAAFRTIAAVLRAPVLCNVASFLYIAFTLLLNGFIIPQGMLIYETSCQAIITFTLTWTHAWLCPDNWIVWTTIAIPTTNLVCILCIVHFSHICMHFGI